LAHADGRFPSARIRDFLFFTGMFDEVLMKPLQVFTFAAAAVALSSVFSSPAVSRSVYDGAWSVVIITDNGACDRAYRYSVAIQNGLVTASGGSFAVQGRVARNGRVRVSVFAGNQRADGSGRLATNIGAGTWRGQGRLGYCAGRWTAERR
jgi:hypothetical protein